MDDKIQTETLNEETKKNFKNDCIDNLDSEKIVDIDVETKIIEDKNIKIIETTIKETLLSDTLKNNETVVSETNVSKEDIILEENEIARYKDILGQSIKIKIRDEHATLYFNNLASQSNASVLITYKLISILCTIDISDNVEEYTDFAQLTVHFLTKGYAFSRIPGGPNKREGKSSEKDILISRLIDRTIRPIINPNFKKPTQLICTLLSHHTTVTPTDIDAEFLAVLASIATLQLSSVPIIQMPFGCRIAMKGNELIFLPYIKELQKSQLDLFLSFAGENLIMIECEAKNVDKSKIVEAVALARNKKLEIESQLNSLREFGKEKVTLETESKKTTRIIKVRYGKEIEKLLEIADKNQRNEQFQMLQSKVISELMNDDYEITKNEISNAFFIVKKKTMREKIFKTGIRIDGRKIDELRSISNRMNIPFMQSSHGSAFFTRGKTKALVSVILGTAYDEQAAEGFESDRKERFILHYNFPPYATGEASQLKTPNRREIGHAKLAFKALKDFIPEKQAFPYTIRVSSEILSCDGSSSMATICGATLAMIDAGVPLSRFVAGIAIGVVVQSVENDEIILLSDLIGDEDHLGDMDFKVAGTTDGITALQMDVKEFGIRNDKILNDILERGTKNINQIIKIMEEEIENQKNIVKKHAPLIVQMSVDKNQAKMVIGNRGDTIRTISEMSGARIDVDSSNNVISIFANNRNAINKAKQIIEDLILQAEVGKIYEDGFVEKITDFGIFVKFLDDKMRGLIHEKNCDNDRYAFHNLKRSLRTGDKIKVKVIFISADGKIGLSPVTEERVDQESENQNSNNNNNNNNNNIESEQKIRGSEYSSSAKQKNNEVTQDNSSSFAENTKYKQKTKIFEEKRGDDDFLNELNKETKKNIEEQENLVQNFRKDPKYNCVFF